MPYYHVRANWKDKIGTRWGRSTDLSIEQINEVVKSIKNKTPFILGKIAVDPSNITITKLEIWKTEARASKRPNMWDWISFYGENVTNDFVISLGTNSLAEKDSIGVEEETEIVPSKNVFIVHGRDHKAMNELKTMLYRFRLNPIVLHEKASGGLTLAEKLEKHAKDVGYAFVILTPDDIGVSFGELYDQSILAVYEEKEKAMKVAERILAQSKGNVQRFIEFNRRFVHDPSDVMEFLSILKARARQNVIFEMGYFWGLLKRRKVCCLLKGDVEKPSDIEGIVYIHFKESVNEVKDRIMKELKEAGYEDLYPPAVPKPM